MAPSRTVLPLRRQPLDRCRRNVWRAIREVFMILFFSIPVLVLGNLVDEIGRLVALFNFPLSMRIQTVGATVYYSVVTVAVFVVLAIFVVRKFIVIRVAKQT